MKSSASGSCLITSGPVAQMGFTGPAEARRWEEAETCELWPRHAFTQAQTRAEAGRLFRHLVCFGFITAEARLGFGARSG